MYVSRYPAALLLPWIARLKTDKNPAEKLLYHRVGGGTNGAEGGGKSGGSKNSLRKEEIR